MSGTTTASALTPATIADLNRRIAIYSDANAALQALQSPGATAQVMLTVTSGSGTRSYGFDLDVAQAQAFFQPVVTGLATYLTAAGVTLT